MSRQSIYLRYIDPGQYLRGERATPKQYSYCPFCDSIHLFFEGHIYVDDDKRKLYFCFSCDSVFTERSFPNWENGIRILEKKKEKKTRKKKKKEKPDPFIDDNPALQAQSEKNVLEEDNLDPPAPFPLRN